MHKLMLLAALAGCISDEPETGELESALSADGWLNDLQIPALESPYQVGLTSFASRIYMVYRPTGSNLLRTSSFDGQRWTSTFSSNLQVDYGPALTVHANQLTTVFKAAGVNRLLMARSSNGNGWTAPVQVGAQLGSGGTYHNAPAAATLGNVLHIAYCYRDNYGERVAVDRLENTTWRRLRTLYLTDGTCKSVALGRTGDGRLSWVFNTETPSTWNLYDGFIDADGDVTARLLSDMKSKKPSSVVWCGGIMHMVHGGYDDPSAIYWTRMYADRWLADDRVPSQASDGGATLACLGGTRAIMVHNGGYDQLWWSEYVPD